MTQMKRGLSATRLRLLFQELSSTIRHWPETKRDSSASVVRSPSTMLVGESLTPSQTVLSLVFARKMTAESEQRQTWSFWLKQGKDSNASRGIRIRQLECPALVRRLPMILSHDNDAPIMDLNSRRRLLVRLVFLSHLLLLWHLESRKRRHTQRNST